MVPLVPPEDSGVLKSLNRSGSECSVSFEHIFPVLHQTTMKKCLNRTEPGQTAGRFGRTGAKRCHVLRSKLPVTSEDKVLLALFCWTCGLSEPVQVSRTQL